VPCSRIKRNPCKQHHINNHKAATGGQHSHALGQQRQAYGIEGLHQPASQSTDNTYTIILPSVNRLQPAIWGMNPAALSIIMQVLLLHTRGVVGCNVSRGPSSQTTQLAQKRTSAPSERSCVTYTTQNVAQQAEFTPRRGPLWRATIVRTCTQIAATNEGLNCVREGLLTDPSPPDRPPGGEQRGRGSPGSLCECGTTKTCSGSASHSPGS